MKIKIALIACLSLLQASAAAAQTGDNDIWPEAWCRQTALNCIQNPGGWATPNECWDAAVGNHCPDQEPSEDPDPNVPCIALPRGTCIPEASPF
jgi:hypothetical protein